MIYLFDLYNIRFLLQLQCVKFFYCLFRLDHQTIFIQTGILFRKQSCLNHILLVLLFDGIRSNFSSEIVKDHSEIKE